jgi:putative aminopeptidase FrvX
MKLLKRLTEACGTPGHEDEIKTIVKGELKNICDRVSEDELGNIIGFKRGKAPAAKRKKIMLAGHMDEIGFIVNHVDDKGFLRILPLGGFDPRTLMAQKVQVMTGKGKKLPGLLNVAGKPIHIQTPEDRKKDLQVNDFYVDLALPAKEVKKLVEIGDRVCWRRDFEEIGTAWSCKAMDDRVGIFVMIEALRKAKNPTHDVYAVGSVQEEIGCRGALVCSYGVDPDIGIALDVTLAADIPGADSHSQVSKFGEGIGIKIMDSFSISDPGLVKEFRALATKHNIKYQLEILPRGGTDAGAMQRSRGAKKVITLSVPTRYVHSVNELVHKDDVQGGIDLLAAYLKK